MVLPHPMQPLQEQPLLLLVPVHVVAFHWPPGVGILGQMQMAPLLRLPRWGKEEKGLCGAILTLSHATHEHAEVLRVAQYVLNASYIS